MTDIELTHPRDRSDWSDIVIVQAVAGVDLKAQVEPQPDRGADPFKLDCPLRGG